MKTKKGFTLVELSIVLVIIGLLIGGVLVAQSLIETAQIQKTIRQIQQVHILASQFKEKTRYLPGDLPNAYTMFSGACGINAIPTSSQNSGRCNGNGDGNIDWGGVVMEYYIFWEHLYLMGMLDTPFTGDGYTLGSLANQGMPGVNIMKLPFKRNGQSHGNLGGLSAAYGSGGSDNYSLHISAGFSSGGCSPQCDGIFYSGEAMPYDIKIDDGVEATGKVQAYRVGGTWGNCDYSNTTQTSCTLRFYQPDEYIK